MLYYIDLYEMIHRPYILKFYIIDTFFSLSLTFLSTPFFYMLLHNLESDLFFFFFFMQKIFQLLQLYDKYIIS